MHHTPDPLPVRSQYKGTRKVRPGAIVLVVAIHVAAFVGLINFLAPELVADAVDSVESLVTVTVTAPEKPNPPLAEIDEPDAGAEGAAGERATPREVVAPEPRITRTASPAPRASSSGTANRSGASQSGSGTGSGDGGDGTGGGGASSGSGAAGVPAGIATRPSVRSDGIDQINDFGIPPGGREARLGTLVKVIFTVTIEGRARGCSVQRSTADAETTARVCPLVIQKVRFNPAIDTNGDPMETRYGYRQTFTAR